MPMRRISLALATACLMALASAGAGADSVDGLVRKAEQGHVDAQYILGFMHREGERDAGILASPTQFNKWIRRAAEQGHAEAQYRLGEVYFDGHHIRRNKAKGLSWIRRAAKQGHGGAQSWLGYAYQKGKGVPQDHAEAAWWFRRGAAQTDDDAWIEFREMYDVDAIVRAAVLGNADDQYFLGLMFFDGKDVPHDSAKAVQWLHRAAKQGQAGAQFWLGYINDEGGPDYGPPKDNAEAVEWYRRAAEQGHGPAQFWLSFMYLRGRGGLPEDRNEAAKWYLRAAERGLHMGITDLWKRVQHLYR